jgi:hypothetical protein
VSKAIAAAEKETKLHALNGGGVLGVVVCIYVFALPPALQDKSDQEQILAQACVIVLGLSWSFLHIFSFWATLALYRLICTLLSLAVVEHIARIRQILANVGVSKEQRLRLLRDGQLGMRIMFEDANNGRCLVPFPHFIMVPLFLST